MYYLAILGVLCCVGAVPWFNGRAPMGPVGLSPRGTDKVYLIQQPVDHFNSTDTRVWWMRFIERPGAWKQGGPIFLFLGGERTIIIQKENKKLSLVHQLVEETNGALFDTEHRYYGESMPLPNKDFNDLQYLNARQALADLARVVEYLKSTQRFRGSKVVLIGSSYSGNLAAWFKLLYPDLADAVLASSAPVLSKTDYTEYLEIITNDFRTFGSTDCLDRIAKYFRRLDEDLKTQEGITKLKKRFNICDSSNMSLPENQYLFVSGEEYIYSYIALHGTVGAIRKHCSHLPDTEPILWKKADKCQNFDFLAEIQAIRNISDALSWNFQLCNEFGIWPSTSSNNQAFGSHMPIEVFYKMCQTLFGEQFSAERIERSVAATNAMYGGRTPAVHKVFFVNGELDPWHRLGVLKNLSQDTPALFIPMSSQCMDQSVEQDDDPVELVVARQSIKKTLKLWIGIHS